jgi:molybdopterin converting factor small subunit
MSAILRLSGPLRDYNGGKPELQVEPGQTVREVVSGLGIVPETIAVVVVNEEQETKDYLIQDGDVVLVLAIIGGG